MANKRKPPKEEVLMGPLWVTTYSDLVSLLVTFFVMLYTFSTMEEDKFSRVRGSLGGGRGAMTADNKQSHPNVKSVKVPPNATTDPEGIWTPARRAELEVRDDLMRKVQDEQFNVPIESNALGDGIRISLEGDRIFLAGETDLLPEADQTLKEMARLVRSLPVSITVEAHVDSYFSKLSRYRDAQYMTREMALNVAEMLVKETGWPPPRVSISPMGDSRPRTSNDTPTGRQRNRRVEILITRYAEADQDG